MRPQLDLPSLRLSAPHPGLAEDIRRLAGLRKDHTALRHGDYRQLHVAAEQLAFVRQSAEERLLVAVNAADKPVELSLTLPFAVSNAFDLLNDQPVTSQGSQLTLQIPARWGQVVRL